MEWRVEILKRRSRGRLDLLEDKIGGGDGAVVAIVIGEGGFHFPPFCGVVGEQ